MFAKCWGIIATADPTAASQVGHSEETLLSDAKLSGGFGTV